MSLICYGLGDDDPYTIGVKVCFKKVNISNGLSTKKVSLKVPVKKLKVKIGVCKDG